jgi:hypothetical protein
VEHETLQVTPAFAGSFVTVAVTCKVFPGWTEPVEGVTTTASEPDVLMAAEVPVIDFVAVSVAVMVWLPAVFSVICRVAIPLASD